MRVHLFSIFHSSLLNFAIAYLYFVFLNVLVNIQMSRHEITFKRSSELKTRILIFRPTRLYTVFFPPPSLHLVCSPRLSCCLSLHFTLRTMCPLSSPTVTCFVLDSSTICRMSKMCTVTMLFVYL